MRNHQRVPTDPAEWTLAAVLVLVTVLTACRDRGGADSERAQPAAVAVASSATVGAPESTHDWFVERAGATGLHFVHFNGMSGEYYFPETIPAGVGLLDYDNDSDLDVYLVQGQMLGEGKTLSQALFPPADPSALRGRLYRNDLEVRADGSRTLRFSDVTDASGVDARGYGMGVATGDIDNDGCIDLYLTNFGRNQLFRNGCDGTFEDVSQPSGTDGSGWGVSASFLDYDRDGWLDLYVGNYVQYDLKTDKRCTNLTGKRDYCTPAVYQPQPDRLYRNDRDGTFTDVTATALVEPFGPALGVVSADFNDDGWMDIYVANDTAENLLWMNQRDGTFKNTALLSGAAVSVNGKPEASMGVDAGDFDNDGDEDLFTTVLPAEGINLFVNDGTGLFEDMSAPSQLGPSSLGYSGWGTAWVDFDNDGWLDVLAVNGAIQAIEGRGNDPFPYAERKLLFRNRGDGRFVDVTGDAGAAFKGLDVGRGAAFGDIDNDGDVDVLIGNLNGPVRLLVNNIGARNHSVCLRLVGEGGPAPAAPAPRPGSAVNSVNSFRPARSAGATGRDMLGTRVEVIRKGRPTVWRRVRTDGSYASANDPRVLVGLGDSTDTPTIRVRWPDGRVQEWPRVPIDRCTTLQRGRATSGS
jgi:hypothetical protein